MANEVSIVLDTNVLISAFWGGHPGQIVELFYKEKIDFYYSQEIFKEYTNVLFRPKFSIFSEKRRKLLLESIVSLGYFVIPTRQISLITADPSDNKFLDCAINSPVEYLITGNIHHFNFEKYQKVKIVSPAQFLLEFQNRF